MQNYHPLRLLWKNIPRVRQYQFCLLLLLMILVSFAEIVSISAVVPFLGILASPDSFLENSYVKPFAEMMDISDSRELLFPLTIAFCSAALISGLMRFILLWAQTRLSNSIGSDLSVDMYRRTLYQPYAIHLERNTSIIISGISRKTSIVVEQVMFPAMIIISASLMLVAISTTLIVIDYRIAISAIVIFGLIYSVVATFTRRQLFRNSNQVSVEQDQVIKALQEGLGGIRDVLIDGSQEAYSKIYQNSDVRLRRGLGNIQIISVSPRYFIEVLGMVLLALMALTLVDENNGLLDAIPVLGSFALGAIRLLPVVQQIYQSYSQIRGGEASLVDVLSLLEQPLPLTATVSKPMQLPFNESIVLKDIFFRYSSNLPLILEGINFKITKGSKVGIIGTTGSGKSTLIDILMALLTPTNGSFLADNIQIDSLNSRSWQALIAHVPQTIFLSDSSIAENIAFGIPKSEIDYERVKLVCAMAQIDKTIEDLENQYETFVGERGIRLSGGQRQRIGIARALYKDAKIIVLDEATSALDNRTENDVMQTISEISDEVTIIIVAHRLTTLRFCDLIIELKNGKVNRMGSYEEVINQ